MNFDILGNWKGGAIRDAGDEAIRKYGSKALDNIDIGLLESGFGATEDHVRNYIKRKQQEALNSSELRNRAINAGLTGADGSGGADFDDTTGSYLSKIVKQEDAKKKQADAQALGIKREEAKAAQTRALELGQQGIDAANTRFSTQLESQRLENQATRDQQNAQYAHTSEQNALTRRHETERGDKRDALSLQMQVMQNDLAEKRMDYDRETARMDKRSAAIAQLMSGLGSLGGAFSL